MSILDRYDSQMNNMTAMMQRLGLDSAEIAQRDYGLTLASAIRACRHCPVGDVCRNWLAHSASALSRAPPFCPNAERFGRLIADAASERVSATCH